MSADAEASTLTAVGWEVVARTDRRATISLCRCDGGEEVDRFTTADPAALDHLAGRTRSDD